MMKNRSGMMSRTSSVSEKTGRDEPAYEVFWEFHSKALDQAEKPRK
jgi:hypothetical protein